MTLVVTGESADVVNGHRVLLIFPLALSCHPESFGGVQDKLREGSDFKIETTERSVTLTPQIRQVSREIRAVFELPDKNDEEQKNSVSKKCKRAGRSWRLLRLTIG